MYYRFKIPEIIDADKCIYAEADSIFDFDVKEYWNIDIGNNYFAAVRDWFWADCEGVQFYQGYIDGMDLSMPAYLTGNIIMNLAPFL